MLIILVLAVYCIGITLMYMARCSTENDAMLERNRYASRYEKHHQKLLDLIDEYQDETECPACDVAEDIHRYIYRS